MVQPSPSDMDEEEKRLRDEMLNPLRRCPRCTEVMQRHGEDVMEEIVFHLLAVLSQEAIHRWFHTWNRRLLSTPVLALQQNRTREVLALTRGYEDPSFS